MGLTFPRYAIIVFLVSCSPASSRPLSKPTRNISNRVNGKVFKVYPFPLALSILIIDGEVWLEPDALGITAQQAREYGMEGLEMTFYFHYTSEIRKRIVLDIEKNHLTLHAASIKYGPNPDTIKVWLRIYRSEGLSGLERIKERGSAPDMGRPKKNSKPLTELERLRKEVQELRTENALLKKVRALVEERNARLREIGHGPSKD